MSGAQATGPGWRSLAGLAVAAVVLHYLSLVLLPFVLAAIVAFVTEPVVGAVKRRTGWPRWVAATLVFLALVAVGGGLAALAVVSAAADVQRLAANGPQMLHDLLQKLTGPAGVQVFGARLLPDQITADVQRRMGAVLNLDTAARAAPAVLGGVLGAVLFAFLSFYMILSGPELAKGALWLAPPAKRPAVERLLPEVTGVLRRFYVGVLVVVVFTAVAAWVGYGLVLHVHGALVLALVLGVLETVPAVGPLISAALVAVAALQLGSLGAVALMVGYAVALRLVIDDVLAPLVLGRSVTVHPVVVILAYVLGAVMFGVTGLLLAIPGVAILRIWLRSEYEGSVGGP